MAKDNTLACSTQPRRLRERTIVLPSKQDVQQPNWTFKTKFLRITKTDEKTLIQQTRSDSEVCTRCVQQAREQIHGTEHNWWQTTLHWYMVCLAGTTKDAVIAHNLAAIQAKHPKSDLNFPVVWSTWRKKFQKYRKERLWSAPTRQVSMECPRTGMKRNSQQVSELMVNANTLNSDTCGVQRRFSDDDG